jgi:uncharacterized protein with NRDE domain
MCLATFAINASAKWPLVIASNRDEFFDRLALPLAQWQTSAGDTIISGRDLLAGGTWLGITPAGRIGLLTNVRELKNPASPRSRGELIMQWLSGSMDADQFAKQCDSAAYGGFNLVLGDVQTGQWCCLSNRPQADGLHSQPMADGVYGLSNAALDTPWPKTLALKAAMQQALKTESEDLLWQALASRDRCASGALPETGIPAELEAALSSAFVDAPERGYGTRCSTVLIATTDTRNWRIQVTEKTYALSPQGVISAGSVQRLNLTLKHSNQGLQLSQ